MKHRMKILAVLLLLLLLPILGVSAASPGERAVYDRAGLFTESEIGEITRAIEGRMQDGDYLVVATTSGTKYYGEHFLRDHPEYNGENLVLLVITYDNGYYYDLYIYGEADGAIKPSEYDVILDDEHVYPNLKSGKLLLGTLGFIEIAGDAYYGRVSTSMLTIVLVSLTIALVIGGIAVAIVAARYKMKIKPTNYPLETYTALSLQRSNDIYLGTTTRRRVISSSSSGKSGGGGRGGGRGHAGGR